MRPSGHAINAVPVTENSRIPEITEIVNAQLFAGRLIEHAVDYEELIDILAVDRKATEIAAGGEVFRRNVMGDSSRWGCKSTIRSRCFWRCANSEPGGWRRGSRGEKDAGGRGRRRPLVPASTYEALAKMASERLSKVDASVAGTLAAAGLRVLVATTNVHEHGKMLLETVLRNLGVTVIDGGVSTDPDALVRIAGLAKADIIALSSYNGVALRYFVDLRANLERAEMTLPVVIGGRLNQVPDNSNSSLRVDVSAYLAAGGALVCTDVLDLLPNLEGISAKRGPSALS